jgi:DNA (cytosine-5)-methyltransferase 1
MTSIHPEADRFLSPRECARIQSFPDQFIFKGTTIENYTQVCNAVPPLVARAFGRYLLNILKGQNIPATPWDITRHSENDNGRDNLDTKINQENFPIQLKLPF